MEPNRTTAHAATVVDFARYRARGERRRRPLLDDEAAPTPISPSPWLSLRQIEHRERMLRHLAGGPLGPAR